jgi:hypothetical protein
MANLAKTDEAQKLAVLTDPGAIMQRVQTAIAALDGDTLSPWDLSEVKMPAGGGTTWELSTIDGDLALKEITGVILVAQRVRQYYREAFTGGNAPPDCASADGRSGIGTPGGSCETCPLSQWGSDGAGQACGERRHILLLTDHSALPIFVNIPPSSLAPLKQYTVGLIGMGQTPWQVVTSISLEKAKSQGGIDYSKARFARVGVLDAEQSAVAMQYREAMQSLVTRRITEAPRPIAEIDVNDFTSE